MPRRSLLALLGAAAGVALLLLTWYATFHIGFFERADGRILNGFAGISRPRIDSITNRIASFCDPKPFVFFAAAPVLVALLRRRVARAAAVAGILLGANLTTQLLKPLLAQPRTGVLGSHVTVALASWPSGHATAAMSLALCAVLASSPRWRPGIAALGAAFAVAVSYSFLELGWHYPSDVLGGFLIALTWTLLGAAGIFAYDRRRRAPGDAEIAARTSLGAVLWPSAAVVACAVAVVGLIALARPHEVLTYAREHTAFIVGAAAIGTLALVLAAGVTLLSGMETRPRGRVPRTPGRWRA